jgi:hypothetical protein
MEFEKYAQEVGRYFHKDINAYEVVSEKVTTFFVSPYAYLKTDKNGKLSVVAVEGHFRTIRRRYVHLEKIAA